MKTKLIVAVALIAAALVPAERASAQTPTPTTRILAIGTVKPGADAAAARTILPSEVRETVKLYLDGKIDQWYSLQDRIGVAFVLNETDMVAARKLLDQLPLGRAHLMTFDLLPLGPLNPLRQLQETPLPSR